MDDLEMQSDEIEVLTSIYGNEWNIDDASSREYSIKLIHSMNKNLSITLCFTLPVNYPTFAPPTCELSAPAIKKFQKDLIYDELNKLYLDNIGGTILYQWIEKVRELLESFDVDVVESNTLLLNKIVDQEVPLESSFEIVHGEIIEDRKSAFQAHVIVIKNQSDVSLALRQLKLDRKIDGATHNIMAWRCDKDEDFDDDGESTAGRRLLSLLQLTNVKNILVVVTRWYGGTLLGKTRFRHINNAARQALVQAGVIDH